MSNNGQGELQKAGAGLAATLALIAAFMGTPYLDRWTSDFAMGLVVSAYGYDFVPLARIIWTLLLGAVVFFFSRALIALAIMIIASWGVMRFGAFI
ncbi:MAG: hypothetical protein AAF234_13735 [Pseudomonadota bacterium]